MLVLATKPKCPHKWMHRNNFRNNQTNIVCSTFRNFYYSSVKQHGYIKLDPYREALIKLCCHFQWQYVSIK